MMSTSEDLLQTNAGNTPIASVTSTTAQGDVSVVSLLYYEIPIAQVSHKTGDAFHPWGMLWETCPDS